MKRRDFLTAATAIVTSPAIARAQVLRSAKASLRLATLSHGLVQPWGMAFLPDGRILITERPGRLRVFANGRLEPTPLSGVPRVAAHGQGGLLDVCLHPDFARNRVLYLSYSAEGQVAMRPLWRAPSWASVG
jgi:glucose/arabinose dehydrogenase